MGIDETGDDRSRGGEQREAGGEGVHCECALVKFPATRHAVAMVVLELSRLRAATNRLGRDEHFISDHSKNHGLPLVIGNR